ncbi:MAG: hypothetical protein ACH36C_06615 [Ilumatobacteraceae bacterium]
MKRLFITATLVGSLLVSTSHVSAASPPDIGMPDQSALDVLSPTNATWANMTGGVAARPYVTALSVINGGVSTPLITNGTTTAETNVPMGRIAVAVAPFNLCRTGQTPAYGVCYATPNRIGITVGFQIQPGQLGYDFSRANNLLTPVTADTEFDITLNMNTLGRTLRWSWASGVATYWNTSNLGTDGASIRIRLKPTLTPLVMQGTQQLGCSAVPVMACSYTQNTHETLSASLVLSLDNTLGEIFTGALFSSTRSYMGSLMVQPGETPQMTYGVSAPQTWSDGTPNAASMSAVLSDAALLNFYGATPEMIATPEFQTGALNLARTDGGTQGAITWTRWTLDVQGVDGWLVTIPDIRFVAAVATSGVRAAGSAVAPATFAVKSKTSAKITSKRVGSKAMITLRVSAAACAKYSCRVVVSSISSTVSSGSKKITALAVSTKSKSVLTTISAKSSKGQRLSVMLQAKKAGKWVYASSAVAKA